MNRRRRGWLLCLAICTFFGFVSAVVACNIPVFRFALERWTPDPYRMIVFHKGTLTASDRRLVDQLQEFLLSADCPANCTIDIVDIAAGLDRDTAEIWQKQKDPSLPWLVVRYPKNAKTPPRNAYEGPLSASNANRLLDSPARREIARRLLEGTSAVWVFVASGDKEKDDAKLAWLDAHLKKLERELKLPELTAAPKDKLEIEHLKLKIEFSVLRLSRTDPDEAMLVQMLLGTESDLDGCREPIVFPVFGRGLVLYAMLGKGINETTVGKAAQFILGPCSCEVKEQNPGVDLLMSVDWERGLKTRLSHYPELPPLTGLAQPPLEQADGAPASDSVARDAGPARESSAPFWTSLLPAAGAIFMAVVLGTVVLLFWKTH